MNLWQVYGFSSRDARAWTDAGCPHPAPALQLLQNGVDAARAAMPSPSGPSYGALVFAGAVTPGAVARAIVYPVAAADAVRRATRPNGRRAADTLTGDLLAWSSQREAAPVARSELRPVVVVAPSAPARPALPAEFPPNAPVIVSYGSGVDSTGVLVEFVRRGIRPDFILFADTGGEHPETYLYLDVMDAYLARHGFPTITRVKKKVKAGTEYDTLESNCTAKSMLPSIAYGSHKHSCSLKWKVAPMDSWIRAHVPAVVEAKRRKRRVDVVRVIGYDAGPADIRRRQKLESETKDKVVNWHYWYPLQEWGWDRERTLQEIVRAGLPPPPKSACFFCPSQKPWELLLLAIDRPELAWRIVEMERHAGPNLDTLDGLWRAGVKGTRKGVAKPGSMTEFLIEWMADGRAYKALPSLSDKGVAPSEILGSSVGPVYRRRSLPVAGQDPGFDDAALRELARRGAAAAEALRARYEATYGPYVPLPSIAAAAQKVESAVKKIRSTAKRLAVKSKATDAKGRAKAAELREELRAAEAHYDTMIDHYRAARIQRGAKAPQIEKAVARFERKRRGEKSPTTKK